MNATLKDCDLPAADSCAIMEGEDVEDDLIFTSKKLLFGKIKSFTSKISGRQLEQAEESMQQNNRRENEEKRASGR
ncbi:UPF0577 protein KIAA1324-like [Trachypithecus francoisi]|uniref:UPF0577 protein KIAA1324-like n=1 Tax=Trachypithecus francoisi TaxID=54180 RepID=UPI00141BD579|nr:UPF0577 protein KIAA1324-like [Trachypithecus francoisi]